MPQTLRFLFHVMVLEPESLLAESVQELIFDVGAIVHVNQLQCTSH